MLARLQHGRYHCVDGRVFGAHVIARALKFGGLAAPVKGLFISRRERLVPAVLDHVKIESKLALVELNGIDRSHRGLDPRALQIAHIGKRNPLLVARCHENFEGQGRLGGTLPQHRSVQIIARLGQQPQRIA